MVYYSDIMYTIIRCPGQQSIHKISLHLIFCISAVLLIILAYFCIFFRYVFFHILAYSWDMNNNLINNFLFLNNICLTIFAWKEWKIWLASQYYFWWLEIFQDFLWPLYDPSFTWRKFSSYLDFLSISN